MADPRAIVRDILRVDHAGEFGAIRIYRAQRAIARRRAPDLIALIDDALSDERRHCRSFAAQMTARDIRPCALLPLWGVGGTVLGGATALLGREAILVCTQAVERTVHRHMNDQITWLAGRDPDLAALITTIRNEEVDHLTAATRVRRETAVALRLLDGLVAAATEVLVWVSTYGASSRLVRRMRRGDR